MKKKNISGISLIEMLIVIGIFAILGILSTRAILLTLQGSKKGDNQIKVRENLDYAVSVMERQLRNAGNITTCPNADTLIVSYSDSNDILTSFSCVDVGPTGYVASGSARLTSDEISVTNCSFTCTVGTDSTPPKVAIQIEAMDAKTSGSQEGSNISISTEINLRTY